MGWEWGRATVKSRDRDQEHSVWRQLSLGHRTGLVKTVVTFNNLDETGGHRQSEPCRPEGQTLKDSTCMRNLQQSNSEAGSRMVVAQTRGRGKWGTAVCVCVCVCARTLSHVLLFVTPWTVDCQAPLFMEFYRQEHWSGLPFPPPGDLPNLGIEPTSLVSPALAGGFFTTSPPAKCCYGELLFMGKKFQFCKMKN